MKAFLLFLLIVTETVALGQSGGRFTLTRSVIAGGGATVSSSAHFKLASTVAQPLAAVPSSQHFSIQGGFWIWPAPIILPPKISGTNAIIPIQTELGKTYVVQGMSSLSSPQWQNVSTNVGNGGIVTVTNSAAGSSGGFFRVIEQ